MPLIVHNHYHQHLESPHHSRQVNERLGEILNKLDQLKVLLMIPKEVQDLIDQAKQNNSVLLSMETHYNALATLVGTLQTTINDLKAGSLLTDEDKAAIVAQTSDLAAAFSEATSVISKNTPLENGTDITPSNPAPAPAPTETTGAATATETTGATTQDTTGSDKPQS